MMYIRYILFTIASFTMELLGLFIVPIGLLFCINNREQGKDKHMPKLFWAWDNAEDGINYNVVNNFTGYEMLLNKNTSFYWRWNWLALRNRIYNFSKYVLGIYKKDLRLSFTGDIQVSDVGYPGCQRIDSIGHNNKKYFQIYWVYQYKWFPSRCFRLRLGWKLDSATDYAMHVLVVHPWKKFNVIQILAVE